MGATAEPRPMKAWGCGVIVFRRSNAIHGDRNGPALAPAGETDERWGGARASHDGKWRASPWPRAAARAITTTWATSSSRQEDIAA